MKKLSGKKIIALLLALVFLLSGLSACGKMDMEPAEAEPMEEMQAQAEPMEEMPAEAEPTEKMLPEEELTEEEPEEEFIQLDYSAFIPETETSRVIGLMKEREVRFEEFGVSFFIPEQVIDGWVNEDVPQTFEELDDILAAEECFCFGWMDFETDEGTASAYINILSAAEGTREQDVMNYFAEYYKNEPTAEKREIKRIPLGNYDKQICFEAVCENEAGGREDFLVFNKIAGKYRVECAIRTFEWNGAEALASQCYCVDKPNTSRYETAPLVGDLENEAFRFDAFKLSLLPPNEDVYEEWAVRSVPQTMEELDSTLESADSVELLYAEFKSGYRPATIYVSLFPIYSRFSEMSLLSSAKEYYENEEHAIRSELTEIKLGENEKQLVLNVTVPNAEWEEENITLIHKGNLQYGFDVEIRTFGRENSSQKLAEELLYVDSPPEELPFEIDENGLFLLKDKTIFSKSLAELSEELPGLSPPEDFPWWDIPLTSSSMELDEGYFIELLFKTNGELYCVMTEEVEADRFDSAFEEAEEISNGIYYYYNCLNTAFFVDAKNYEFFFDEDLRFTFARVSNDYLPYDRALCQRYYHEAINADKIIAFADAILIGELKDLSAEHAMKLAAFAAEHFEDAELMKSVGDVYASRFKNMEKAAEWYKKAAEMGNEEAAELVESLLEQVK